MNDDSRWIPVLTCEMNKKLPCSLARGKEKSCIIVIISCWKTWLCHQVSMWLLIYSASHMVWRIGTDTFPTRAKIASRMGPMDSSCPLCCEEEESSIHLFFKCPVSRAIWFGCQWGFRMDQLHVASCSVIDPPCAYTPEVRFMSSLQMALTLEFIWLMCNRVVHDGDQILILPIVSIYYIVNIYIILLIYIVGLVYIIGLL